MNHRYTTIFLDVDTQFDFIDPHGALYVPRAERIVPNLRRLFAVATQLDVPVVSTADYHTPDDPEFADFPPHCVQNTHGQQRLPDTLMPDRVILDPDEDVPSMPELLQNHSQVILRKRTVDIWTSAAARQMLAQVDADAWYVFGVAADYCILSAALGLAKAGKPTYVVTDAIEAITPEGRDRSLEQMKAAGVRLVTTDDVLRSVQGAASIRK